MVAQNARTKKTLSQMLFDEPDGGVEMDGNCVHNSYAIIQTDIPYPFQNLAIEKYNIYTHIKSVFTVNRAKCDSFVGWANPKKGICRSSLPVMCMTIDLKIVLYTVSGV